MTAPTFERMKQKLKLGVSSDGRQTRTYNLEYLAKSTSNTELTVQDVLSGLGLTTGSTFADDGNATLADIEIDRLPTIVPYCRWSVSIVYATNAKVPENNSDDPTQFRVKRSKKYSELTKFIIKDRAGNLIINAAKEPYKDGVPVADYPNTFCYDWNRATPTRGYHETVNQSTFNGCQPGTLLCLITTEEVFEGSYNYWHENIEMRYNPDGWNPQPLNAGTKEMSYTGTTANGLVECKDLHRQPCTEPQPLYDGTVSGLTKQAGMMVPISDRPGGCVYLTVDHYQQTQFEKIGVREFPV